ncbi:hypothetical protein [Thermococcus sp. 21S7]|uniref:hypothetical protein n=1 Tax=Thermococcus sp. 21S7 TaxID=1638221 RepID=UPI001438C957|nr:hypothetical protein [Thermococcus sp. 21S7]NJE60447.1 hypothetical protein [Thermococcus sp. 21S7]
MAVSETVIRLDRWFNSKPRTTVEVRVRDEKDRETLRKEYVPLVVEVVENYFPELRGFTFRLHATYTAHGRYQTIGYPYNLALNPELLDKFPVEYVRHIIAHELTHLVQYNYRILKQVGVQYFPILYTKPFPKGEESCDLYTYARDPDLVVPGRGSYIPIPAEADPYEVYELANEAIRLRNEEGLTAYIKWFKKELRRVSHGC